MSSVPVRNSVGVLSFLASEENGLPAIEMAQAKRLSDAQAFTTLRPPCE